MGFAASNRTSISICPETVFGEIPVNPSLDLLRMTGESLNYNITNTVSEELRSDRMSGAAIQTSAETAGDINIELSFGTYDTLLEAFCTSRFSSELPTAIGVDADSASKTFSFVKDVTFTEETVRVGNSIVITGCANNDNNGVFVIQSVDLSGSDVVITVQEPIVTESSASAKARFTQILKNGVLQESFFIQKFLQDADVPTYFNFSGMRANNMSLEIATGAILTGTFSFMGTKTETSTTQIPGATVNPVSDTEVMNATSDIMNVLVDGMPTGCFNSLSISMANNLRGQDCVGTLGHVGIAYGTIDLTGNISLYFKDAYDYDKYVNAEHSSISFRIEDNAGNFYIMRIPRFKFDTGTVVAGGKDQDVMFEASIRAEVDPAEQTLIIIERYEAK